MFSFVPIHGVIYVIPDPLAYLTAKTNNLPEIAQEILEEAGLTEADVDDIPDFGTSTLKPPVAVTPISDLVWPSIGKGESFFDRALANGNLEADGEVPYLNGVGGAAASSALDDWAKDEEVIDDIPPEEGGWDLDAGGADAQADTQDEVEEIEEPGDSGAAASPGVKESELWVRNSPFPADHVAAGSFETAMQASSIQFNHHYFLLNLGSTAVIKPTTRRSQLRASKTFVHCCLPVSTRLPITECLPPSFTTKFATQH